MKQQARNLTPNIQIEFCDPLEALVIPSFFLPGMAIYFLYGVHNSKEGLGGDSRSRDFLQRLTGSARDVCVRARSVSSDEGPLSPSSDSENDEGFQSNLMTSEDESPKHALIKQKETISDEDREKQN